MNILLPKTANVTFK